MIRTSIIVGDLVIKMRRSLFLKRELKIDNNQEYRFFFNKGVGNLTLQEAFGVLTSRGLIDIKMGLLKDIKDIKKISYLNGYTKMIVCYFKDAPNSLLIHNQKRKDDKIINEFLEYFGNDSDVGCAKDTEGFISTLEEIAEFSKEISPHYQEIFLEARDVLLGRIDIYQDKYKDYIKEEFTEELNRIIVACYLSDVFGGMGSWNDSPSYEASELGKEQEYNRLSEKLYNHVKNHTFYVVNNCYK